MKFLRHSRQTSRSRSQVGAAVVESAIMLPFLFLLMIGTVEVGRFAYFGIYIANAAEAGAAYGAQNSTTAADGAGIVAAAQADGGTGGGITASAIAVATQTPCYCYDRSTGTLDTSNSSCAQTCSTGSLVPYVQVQTSGTISPLFPANQYFFLGTRTFTSTVQLRICTVC